MTPLGRPRDARQRTGVILTAARYFPWDGSAPTRPDRIWNRLDVALGIPLLIYGGRIEVRSVHHPDARRLPSSGVSLRVLRTVLGTLSRSLIRSVRSRNARHLLFAYRLRVIPWLTWYLAHARIRLHLEEERPHFVIFHGEFNAWGRAVALACRDAGVPSIAWQHGIYGPEPRLPLRPKDTGLVMPDHLLVWSEFSLARTAGTLAELVPRSVGGTGRLETSYRTFTAGDGLRVLLSPGVHDHVAFRRLLRRWRPAIGDHAEVALRPHPLRPVRGRLPQPFVPDEGGLDDSLARTHVVVCGFSSLAVEALRRQIPIVVPAFLYSGGSAPLAMPWPGIHICEEPGSLDATIGAAASMRPNDREALHGTARRLASDLRPEVVTEILSGFGRDGA